MDTIMLYMQVYAPVLLSKVVMMLKVLSLVLMLKVTVLGPTTMPLPHATLTGQHHVHTMTVPREGWW